MSEKADSPMPNGTVKRKNNASSSEVGSKIANKVFCRDSKMPPRKKSRVTSVVLPEKIKLSAVKALCRNTGFMVDFLGYFTRDDFEKYLQLTCNRMNQLILTHFHSKPYRYLDNVTLICNLNVRKLLCLSKTTDRSSTIRWDPSARQWTNPHCFVGFSKLREFLNMTVRVPKVDIWIGSFVMSQEETAELKSLSHIWENAQVEFTTGRYSKENLVSYAELLNETRLFRCRLFKCLYVDDMLPLWEYPGIYSLEAVKIHIASLAREGNDLTPIIKLIENRALYPNSQTTFVLTGSRYVNGNGTQPQITNVLQRIANEFMKSDKAQSFQIIFHFKFAGVVLLEGEKDEFRLQNNRTREVLKFRRVTDFNEVAKYCEFDAKEKYFILERSLK